MGVGDDCWGVLLCGRELNEVLELVDGVGTTMLFGKSAWWTGGLDVLGCWLVCVEAKGKVVSSNEMSRV